MSNKKVSDLADGGAVQDTDEFYAQRGSSQVKISGDKFGGSQPIVIASVQIGSAELKALNGTPKQLLAAPGGRNYYVPHALILHYRFGTTPYSGTFSPQLGFGLPLDYNDGTNLLAILPATTNTFAVGLLLQQTEDAYRWGNVLSYPWLASAIENVGLFLGNSSADVTAGDGTLTARVFYSLIDGAP